LGEANRLEAKYYNYRRYNKQHGINTNLTLHDLILQISTTPCVYCNSHEEPGLDRIDKEKGYTIDNIKVSCKRCIQTRISARVSYETMLKIGEVIRSSEEKIEEN